MKFVYPGIIAELPDGSYHVRFPDLDMCEAIEGDYYTIMGLPIAELNRKLNGSRIFYRT